MRLWHQKLLPLLPRQQLLGQHRECCALRGKGWGQSHSTVNYVFDYSPARLVLYHELVMDEMISRGYNPDQKWFKPRYRGRKCSRHPVEFIAEYRSLKKHLSSIIFPEHNAEYLQECLLNLQNKGVACNYFEEGKG